MSDEVMYWIPGECSTVFFSFLPYSDRGLSRRHWGRICPSWGFVAVGLVSFLIGGRWVYLVYDVANAQVAFLLFWDMASWYLT
ncbi:hypothetical protein EV401DRAFT_1376280 [Pisolithus croceorrhizus]|nr:hypothetical protein EV401DRAFT_1376280 [Pisolithus croceorrhizus]